MYISNSDQDILKINSLELHVIDHIITEIIQVERTSGLHPFKKGGIDILYVVSSKLHWQVLWDVSQQKKA